MVHQVDIAAIVMANLFQTVSEFLPFREQLFEARPATVQRMTAGIDDFRIWQDEMNESEMAEIVRHLISKEGCPCPMHPSGTDVVLAEFGEVIIAELRQNSRIPLPIRCDRAPPEPVCRRQNIWQLERAINLTM